MRNIFYNIALTLKSGREKAVAGDKHGALLEFNNAIYGLRELPPERTRDVLLAHSYLAKYQTLQLEDRGKENKLALESLHLGVSYARSTKDPIARAIAEECISGLDVAL
jgi:hypothetical protein